MLSSRHDSNQSDKSINALFQIRLKSINGKVNAHVGDNKDDSIAALEECRLALEKIVIPLGRPMELLPRNMKVLQIQADLIHRYRLRCDIFGDDDQQRIRVYPP